MIKHFKEILNIKIRRTSGLVLGAKKAFTLAEVLVVIGIIGVVSALTIPNLQQGTNSQEVITKVTKARATISEAFGRSIATYGDPCTWANGQTTAATQTAIFYNRLFENLKTSKECGLVANTNTTCWSETAVNLDANYYKAVLADGTSIAMYVSNTTLTSGYGCGKFGLFTTYLDIDGPNKGIGSSCDDIYALSLTSNNQLERGYSGNLLKNPWQCAEWVLDKQNADFLKATYINNTFKCKNSTVLDWANNTTCN